MKAAKVSVIIPSFNSGHFVVQAIQSAINQTIGPVEVIVVDDGSTDDTTTRLQPYREKIVYVHQKNGGLSSARNAGMRTATGEWFAFLDADDAWHPRKLELQLNAFHSRPELGMLGTDTFRYPIRSFPEIAQNGSVQTVPLEKLLIRNYFTASSVLIRRSIAERVGEFDISLPNAEDLDYWQRTAELCGVANLKLPLTGYRIVPGSLSRRPKAMEVGIHRVLKKLDDRGAWQGRLSLRRKAISHFHYSCAHLYGTAGHQAFAIRRLLQSMAWYPFPYERSETGAVLARPRRLAVLALRMLRLMPPEPAIVAEEASHDV